MTPSKKRLARFRTNLADVIYTPPKAASAGSDLRACDDPPVRPHRLLDDEVCPWHIPRVGVDAWADVYAFAHSFNGYEVLSDLDDPLLYAAVERFDSTGEVPVTLRTLRTLLFAEARALHLANAEEEPDDATFERCGAYLEAIRVIVDESRQSPLPRTVARMTLAWRRAHEAWIDERPLPIPFDLWKDSYKGSGAGKVDADALPEPWIGSLERSPLPVILGLNPGGSDAAFQHRNGRFVQSIRQIGYSAWAGMRPYQSDEWLRVHDVNIYDADRTTFLERWNVFDPSPADHLLVFEAYPWHSEKLTAKISPPPWLLQELVLEPAAALGEMLFAFGAAWHGIARDCGLPPVPFRVEPSWKAKHRKVLRWRLPNGKLLVTESHSGSARPPAGDDLAVLQNVISEYP